MENIVFVGHQSRRYDDSSLDELKDRRWQGKPQPNNRFRNVNLVIWYNTPFASKPLKTPTLPRSWLGQPHVPLLYIPRNMPPNMSHTTPRLSWSKLGADNYIDHLYLTESMLPE
jgi:hypothetical protein